MHEPSKTKFGSGQGKHTAYAIEVRSTFSEPSQLPCGMIVDREWRKYPVRLLRCDRPDHPFTLSQVNGIPVQNLCRAADDLNLMDFHAAYALMATIQAQANNAEMPLGALCLETRLIEVKVEYFYKASVMGVGDPLSLYDMRRNLNWEKNQPNDTDKGDGENEETANRRGESANSAVGQFGKSPTGTQDTGNAD